MIQKTYLKTKDQCKVKFTVSIENADKVEVVGLNDDWDNPIEMNKKKGDTFEIVQSLPKNTHHEFKYLVNGSEWRNDPEADGEAPNEFGGTNSILAV
ncbi:AMP-activated protein kinase-like protein [Pontibacter ummariensis]|uniref:Glycogen recognition site of AMP-activated protein kinase n=1 Tax=Pontibacter ummariensis TaxID=1610492 RepID=A0A239HXN0_9BACT|nr:isoamylase early set domain-containing protein [Pontibacter ummariensis]PRY10115.1 AMP-activated protein kinase-like protein [Pontibacter ummariensis]SNS86186.1 Glycogen recognition site of AMP-activated protein kinase [Pontibacter ummariensis]